MNRRGCTSDLAVRARRGTLGGAELEALEAHVSACASCRLVLDLGRVFDAPELPAPDDEARIQRLARAAEAWTRHGRAPRRAGHARALRRRVFVLLAACIVLCCGLAAASLGTRAWAPFAHLVASHGPTATSARARPGPPPSSHLSSNAPVAATALAVAPAAEAPMPAVDLAPASSSTRSAEPGPRATMAAGRASSRAPRASGASGVGDGAAAMFGEANDARRGGDDRTAVALYQKLERRFPRSPEAALSAVPLGEMLLAEGRPRDALAQFDRPAGLPGGTFRPEALYGRARSLAALGDEDGERRAWRQLLEEFPKCPYAEAARRRLEARSSPEGSASP